MPYRFSSRPVIRSLFFAIFPDEQTAARIGALTQHWRDRYGLRGKPHAPDRLHVTLVSVLTLPELPPSVLAAVREAAAAVTMPRFQIALDMMMSFNNGAFVLCGHDGTAGVEMLQADVHRAVAKVLPSVKAPPKQPHLTLLYDQKKVERRAIEPISWKVRKFELIESLRGLAIYRRHGSWILRDGRDRPLGSAGNRSLPNAPMAWGNEVRYTKESEAEG